MAIMVRAFGMVAMRMDQSTIWSRGTITSNCTGVDVDLIRAC